MIWPFNLWQSNIQYIVGNKLLVTFHLFWSNKMLSFKISVVSFYFYTESNR